MFSQTVETISVDLEPELLSKLENVAKAYDKTVEEMSNILLIRYIAKDTPHENIKTVVDKVKASKSVSMTDILIFAYSFHELILSTHDDLMPINKVADIYEQQS